LGLVHFQKTSIVTIAKSLGQEIWENKPQQDQSEVSFSLIILKWYVFFTVEQ
jgi:hypothetical protein